MTEPVQVSPAAVRLQMFGKEGFLVLAAVDDRAMLSDDLVRLVAVRLGEGRVDVRDMAIEVMHPDGIRRLFHGGGQERALRLGCDAVGDVLGGPDQPDRRPVGVAHDFGDLVDDPDRSVGPDDPVLRVVRCRVGQLVVAEDGERLVVRVHEAEERLKASGEGAGLDPEDPARLVRPPQVPGHEVSLPAADVGDPLRFVQMVRAGRACRAAVHTRARLRGRELAS